MKRNPEQVAWMVLFGSFAIFVLLVTTLPVAARHLIDTRTSARSARLDIIYGTVLVRPIGTTSEVLAHDDMQIEAGDQVRTAGDARAILWLFDESNVELGPESSVVVRESEETTFTNNYSSVDLLLAEGKPVVNVALPGTRERRFVVSTRIASIELAEGAYEVDVTRPSAGEAVVRLGEARITAAGQTIVCRTGQRAEFSPGGAPIGPLPLSKNLLVNGNFSLPTSAELPLGPGWKGDERNSEGTKGTVVMVPDAAGNYLRFVRLGEGHGENYAVQVLERDVSQFRSLKLRMDVRLLQQSLSGGGIAGSEYPFHVRVLYRDVRGREGRLDLGYFFQNEAKHPTPYGQEAPRGQWFTVERELTSLEPRPANLIYVELVASGWAYESHVRNVELIAE